MFKIYGLMVLAVVATQLIAAGEATPGTTLRKAAGNRMLIGAAVSSGQLDNAKLAEFIADQFNCVTADNEMKPDQLQRNKGTFTFERADKIVAFAQAHDMKVVGHNLNWHSQTPAWMFADGAKPLSREQGLANLKTHIETVMKHYKGKVIGWDVVNEAISDSGNEYLRNTPARKSIGDDWVAKAFEFAHAADPDAELYFNDYNIESQPKRDKTIRLIKDLQSKGLRIDAVGIQGHWLIGGPDPKVIDDAITAYEKLGIKVMITEFDIDPLPRAGAGADVNAREKAGSDLYKNGMPDDVQKKLADRYSEIVKVLVKHPSVTRITFWGSHDGTSWLNNWPVQGRTNHPLLWDRNMQPKPAFNAVLQALEAH